MMCASDILRSITHNIFIVLYCYCYCTGLYGAIIIRLINNKYVFQLRLPDTYGHSDSVGNEILGSHQFRPPRLGGEVRIYHAQRISTPFNAGVSCCLISTMYMLLAYYVYEMTRIRNKNNTI